jgi:hypothetical protein
MQSIIADKLSLNGSLQLCRAVDRRVFGYARIDCCDRRRFYVLRCVEIRVIRSETDKLKSLPPKNRRIWYVIL